MKSKQNKLKSQQNARELHIPDHGGCQMRRTPRRRRPNSETGCCPTTFSAAHKLSAGEDQKDSEADRLGRSVVNISIKEEKEGRGRKNEAEVSWARF